MTIQKGTCAECRNEYDYEYNPKFPRKYCHECSAAKKAQFALAEPVQPVNAPVVKPGTIREELDNAFGKSKPKNNDIQVGVYTSYAKDIFVAIRTDPLLSVIPVDEIMNQAIDLVKQAKEAFE